MFQTCNAQLLSKLRLWSCNERPLIRLCKITSVLLCANIKISSASIKTTPGTLQRKLPNIQITSTSVKIPPMTLQRKLLNIQITSASVKITPLTLRYRIHDTKPRMWCFNANFQITPPLSKTTSVRFRANFQIFKWPVKIMPVTIQHKLSNIVITFASFKITHVTHHCVPPVTPATLQRVNLLMPVALKHNVSIIEIKHVGFHRA